MVFIEHRGSGRASDSDISTMESIWDTEWSRVDISRVSMKLEQVENWRWIKKYISPPGRILEAGCGPAKWVKFLQDQGFEAHGLDYSKVAIDASHARWPELKLVHGDLRNMPYEDGYFKTIVSLGVIEHDEEGPDAILQEMRRVLKPNGILYCTVPCINHLRGIGLLAIRDWIVCNKTLRRLTGRKPDAKFYEYVWTSQEYSKILTKNGFELINLIPLAPHDGYFCPIGSIRRRIVDLIHRRFPWLNAHMMAGVCRKI